MKEEYIKLTADIADAADYKKELESAKERIKGFAERTRMLTGTFLDDLLECEVYLKCEQEQPIGAFKIRGASNFANQLSKAEQRKGLITHSSGNHAQAIAYMARRLSVPAFVVMPSNANKRKIENARRWGAEVTFCEPTIGARIASAEKIKEQTGGTIIPPFDHPWIVYGQATCAMEMIEDVPGLNTILTPLGGGGLLAGTALAAESYGDDVEVIGAEPSGAPDGYESLQSGQRIVDFTPNTVADGLRTPVGEVPFEFLLPRVSEVWISEEKEVVKWMYRLWGELKIVIEPTSAVVISSLMANKEKIKGKQVGVILTGGNVDFTSLPARD